MTQYSENYANAVSGKIPAWIAVDFHKTFTDEGKTYDGKYTIDIPRKEALECLEVFKKHGYKILLISFSKKDRSIMTAKYIRDNYPHLFDLELFVDQALNKGLAILLACNGACLGLWDDRSDILSRVANVMSEHKIPFLCSLITEGKDWYKSLDLFTKNIHSKCNVNINPNFKIDIEEIRQRLKSRKKYREGWVLDSEHLLDGK